MTMTDQRRVVVALDRTTASGSTALPRGLRPAVTARVVLLMLSGAMPVSAIPLYVLGWLSMTDAALFCVLPLSLLAIGVMAQRSPEAVWAARGAGAGLIAVLAYDGVRMPLVWANVWPDFIPRLGASITGGHGTNALVGYTWRYLGDGAGIGLSFFVFCSAVLAIRPALVTTRPVLVSVGYGIVIWTGLLATVELPARGEELLFRLTPASFALSLLGHLIYGTVLGLCLRRFVRPPSALVLPAR
jgi:hypothetical protein